MFGLVTVDGNICLQTNTHNDSRVQSATEELRTARLAFCQALLKVQGLEQDSWNNDQGYRRLLPAGLGQALAFVVVTISKCHAYVCVIYRSTLSDRLCVVCPCSAASQTEQSTGQHVLLYYPLSVLIHLCMLADIVEELAGVQDSLAIVERQPATKSDWEQYMQASSLLVLQRHAS